MKDLSKEVVLEWMWASDHPFLYTVIEISTPALLLAFIAGRLINALVNINNKK